MPQPCKPLVEVENVFRSNIEKVRALLRFDDTVLGFALPLLERIRKSHDKAKQPITNTRFRVDKVIDLLEGIHDNKSLEPTFRTIYNQCLVLAVSYFGAALRDVFKESFGQALIGQSRAPLLKEELKLNIADLLRVLEDPKEELAELVIAKKDLSFQDMRSTTRTFRDLCGFAPERGEDVNDIILAQACRHAIVHAGEVVDAKLLRQIDNAQPRNLKVELVEGHYLSFSPEEVDAACGAMRRYIGELTAGLRGVLWSAA